MKKIIRSLSRIAIINFIFFFIVIYFFNRQIQPLKSSLTNLNTLPNRSVSDPTALDPTPTSLPNLFAQLSLHNNRASCWFIIDGNLFDITSFFGSHPGGDEILLKYCGTDASNSYHTKDKMIPADHSESAKAMLQQYLIQ